MFVPLLIVQKVEEEKSKEKKKELLFYYIEMPLYSCTILVDYVSKL
jgi:hypothetical protein